MENSPQNVIKRIERLMAQKGVSKSELAEHLGYKSNAFYIYFHNGKHLKVEHLINIAKYFDVSLDYLLGAEASKIENKGYMNAFKAYQDHAAMTRNPSLRIKEKSSILISALGMCGEAGEVANYLEKVYGQEHHYEKERVIEEVGDTLWYMMDLLTVLGIDIGEVIEENTKKRRRKFPSSSFSARDSIFNR